MLKDAKADDVMVLDVRPRQCDFTDEIVIATARSKLHCQTAAQAVVYRVRPSHLYCVSIFTSQEAQPCRWLLTSLSPCCS